MQPTSWLGKLVAGVIGVAVMLIAFLLSIVAFAVIASRVLLAIIPCSVAHAVRSTSDAS